MECHQKKIKIDNKDCSCESKFVKFCSKKEWSSNRENKKENNKLQEKKKEKKKWLKSTNI